MSGKSNINITYEKGKPQENPEVQLVQFKMLIHHENPESKLKHQKVSYYENPENQVEHIKRGTKKIQRYDQNIKMKVPKKF